MMMTLKRRQPQHASPAARQLWESVSGAWDGAMWSFIYQRDIPAKVRSAAKRALDRREVWVLRMVECVSTDRDFAPFGGEKLMRALVRKHFLRLIDADAEAVAAGTCLGRPVVALLAGGI